MVAIHIEHKLDVGILTISRINTEIVPSETDGEPRMNDIIQFRFECDATGAWFDADMDRADLSKMCTILGEDDELIETLNDPPSVVISGQNVMTATFMAAGRKRKYPIPISLTKRTYAADKQDIMEIRAENAVLRRKVASLEEYVSQQSNHISCLAENLLRYHGLRGDWKYCAHITNAIKCIDQPIEIAHLTHGSIEDLIEFLNKFMAIAPIKKLTYRYDSLVLCALGSFDKSAIRRIADLLIENMNDDYIVRTDDRKSLITVINEHIEQCRQTLCSMEKSGLIKSDSYSNHKSSLQHLIEFREKCAGIGYK